MQNVFLQSLSPIFYKVAEETILKDIVFFFYFFFLFFFLFCVPWQPINMNTGQKKSSVR